MKNRIITFTLCLLVSVGLIGCLFTGCETMPDGSTAPDIVKIAGLVKVAAYVGTSESLRQHPEWRPGFEAAAEGLGTLETADTLDIADIMAILEKLPVKQLKSDRAVLLITSGTILLQELGGSLLPLDTSQLQPIAKALREGIQLGLGQHPPDVPDSVIP